MLQTPDQGRQLEAWGSGMHWRDSRVDHATAKTKKTGRLDRVDGLARSWVLRQANRSPAYTTRWEELLVARAG